MARLTALNPDSATGKTKALFDAVQTKMGRVPNMMRTMGNSPALLEAYLNFSTALGNNSLGAKLREQLALTVAEANNCDYCLAAHSFVAENVVHLSPATIEASRTLSPIDERTDAALTFARQLVDQQGHVSDEDVAAVRAAGFTEAQVGEIVGQVALSIFTNYFNNTAGTTLDFPAVPVLH